MVIVIDRPDYLMGDAISIQPLISRDIIYSKNEIILQTHSTNPLVKSKTFQSGIELFFENYPNYDSVFSVTKYQNRLWDNKINPNSIAIDQIDEFNQRISGRTRVN